MNTSALAFNVVTNEKFHTCSQSNDENNRSASRSFICVYSTSTSFYSTCRSDVPHYICFVSSTGTANTRNMHWLSVNRHRRLKLSVAARSANDQNAQMQREDCSFLSSKPLHLAPRSRKKIKGTELYDHAVSPHDELAIRFHWETPQSQLQPHATVWYCTTSSTYVLLTCYS